MSLSNKSRFRLYRHSTEAATRELDGLVTMTAFSVPGKFDDKAYRHLINTFSNIVGDFRPYNSEHLTMPGAWVKFSRIWLCVLEEDRWMDEKFRLQPQPTLHENEHGRGIFCHVFLWSQGFSEPHKQEQESVADPRAKQSWEDLAAKLMPPVTTCVQERWDIRQVPRFYPLESEDGSDAEFERRKREILESFKSNLDEEPQ